MGAIINANIFGELAVLLSNINKKKLAFQEKIDTANTAMKNIQLPDMTQIKVLSFLTYTQTLLESQKELETFLEMISPSLRIEVLDFIFRDLIGSNDVFDKNKDLIDFITRNLSTHIYQPEQYIIA